MHSEKSNRLLLRANSCSRADFKLPTVAEPESCYQIIQCSKRLLLLVSLILARKCARTHTVRILPDILWQVHPWALASTNLWPRLPLTTFLTICQSKVLSACLLFALCRVDQIDRGGLDVDSTTSCVSKPYKCVWDQDWKAQRNVLIDSQQQNYHYGLCTLV